MPKSTDSTTKFKVDITDFKAAMQEAARYVKLAESEFNEASAGLGKWSNSADGLTAKLKQLDKVLEAQNRQLDALETEYERVAKEQGENSKGAEELRIRINNQKAAIKRTESQMDHYADTLVDVTKDTDDLGDATLKAGKDAKKGSEGFTVMKGALANLVADGVKLALNSVKKLSGEIINLGKQSISNYARYEQLVGGVETLFGAGGLSLDEYAKSVGKSTKDIKEEYDNLITSQTKVMENAKQAYKTAGMSANEYMDTVTSFSAALISGLDGDTAKAADVADTAITDMSDNANKMGTSIEMIQNAYQGFAKQNYTMLDNLKLGYGGTKGEMARLVKESGILGKAGDKLTAKNLNEKVSFDQMIEAIHKVQQNMGITGTTAKEAAGTIEGSTGSMQAAWENLLTGIADDTQDIDELWNNFLQSAVASAKNMLPRIKKLVNNFSAFVDKKLREKLPEFMKQFDSAREAIKRLFKFIQDNGHEIIAVMQGIAVAFVTYKAVATITSVIMAFKSLVTAIKAGELALVALNSTMSISPIGLFAAAVAGLVVSMMALDAANKKARDSQYGLSDAQKECIENSEKLYEEYSDMDTVRKENNDAILSEYDYLNDLKDEYNSLIDKNGQVKKGYKSRAEFILNELAEAMGVERSEIDKTIKENGKLGESLDKLMVKQKGQALINANQQNYTDAIGKRNEALEQYTQAATTAAEAEKKFNDTLAEAGMIERTFADYQIAKDNNDWKAVLYYQQLYSKETLDNLETTWEAMGKARDGLVQAESAYVGISQTIQNYEGLSAAILEGDSKKIQKAMDNLTNNVVTAKTGTAQTLEQQAWEFRENYKKIAKSVEEGAANVSDADLKASKSLMNRANNELIKYIKNTDTAKKLKESGYELTESLTDGIKDGYISVNDAMGRLENLLKLENGEIGFGYAGTAKKLGVKIPEAIANGIISGTTNDLQYADRVMRTEIDKALEQTAFMAGISAKDIPEEIKYAVETGQKDINTAVTEMRKGIVDNMSDTDKDGEKAGSDLVSNYSKGITDNEETVKEAGKSVYNAAVEAMSGDTTESGKNFAWGFANGINDVLKSGHIGETAGLVSKDAIDSLKKTQQEGSPSKITYKSGQYFTQGYINGILSLTENVKTTVAKLTKTALKQLRDGETVTFKFDIDDSLEKAELYFDNLINKKTQKYEKNISNLEKQQSKATRGLEKERDAEEKKVRKSYKAQIKSRTKYWDDLIKSEQNGQNNYAELRDKEIDALEEKRRNTKSRKKRNNYTTQIEERKRYWKKLIESSKNSANNYETQRDNEIKRIEKTSNKEQKEVRKAYNARIKESEKYYNKLIAQETKDKENFENVSKEMVKSFTKASNEYTRQAKELIDTTIQGVTDSYDEKYNALINKQNELASKLKDFGNLFEISGAGVITFEDINEQTKQINDYAKKLKKIKKKVSTELFDQIASYDIKEGQAFMDHLLGMSEEELKAYDQAYSEKMSLADKLSENIYKKDIKKVNKEYKTAMKEALAGLPEQLEKLGQQAMKGFLKGLTQNTKYMDKDVKKFVNSVVKQFKTELKIKSPSKVMMGLGEYSAEGFGDGLKNMISYVKKAAGSVVNATTTSFDGVKANWGSVKSVIGSNSNGLMASESNVVNNYNLVQNNTSPKALTPLETYNARRQQIAMIKAATQN